jgi:hypothetical protein
MGEAPSALEAAVEPGQALSSTVKIDITRWPNPTIRVQPRSVSNVFQRLSQTQRTEVQKGEGALLPLGGQSRAGVVRSSSSS